jgi:hypothetical protein
MQIFEARPQCTLSSLAWTQSVNDNDLKEMDHRRSSRDLHLEKTRTETYMDLQGRSIEKISFRESAEISVFGTLPKGGSRKSDSRKPVLREDQ